MDTEASQKSVGRSIFLWIGAVVVVGLLLAGAFAGGVFVRRILFPTTAASAESAPEPAGAAEQPAPRLGSLAPGFSLSDLDGNPVSLADFRERPVLINFWATWCGPCEAEMPAINRAYLASQAEGLVVLGIDLEEHPDTIRSFVDYYELDFTILADREGAVAEQYQVQGLPTSFFIDRSGRIAHIHIGQMSEADLENGLAKIR